MSLTLAIYSSALRVVVPDHSMCSNMVTETIEYYVNNNASVYLLLIGASKAFDRLRQEALFQILKQKDICPLISRIIFDMYTVYTFYNENDMK